MANVMNDPLQHALDEGQVKLFYYPDAVGRTAGKVFHIQIKLEVLDNTIIVDGCKYPLSYDWYIKYGEQVKNEAEALSLGQIFLDEVVATQSQFNKQLADLTKE